MIEANRTRLIDGGHVFRVFGDEIDVAEFDGHWWATCVACGEHDCVDCSPEFPVTKCEAPETLPGLDWMEV